MKIKISLFITLFTLAALLMVQYSPLQASLRAEAKATIPFNFFLKNKLMPAGDYTVTNDDSTQGLLLIQNTDKPDYALSLFLIQTPIIPLESGKLIFHKYGDKYFLAEVWDPNLDAKFVAFPSTDEKKARKALEETSSISRGAPDVVAIALNFR